MRTLEGCISFHVSLARMKSAFSVSCERRSIKRRRRLDEQTGYADEGLPATMTEVKDDKRWGCSHEEQIPCGGMGAPSSFV